MRISFTVLDGMTRRDVDVEANAATPVAHVLRALDVPPEAPLFDGALPLAPDAPLADSGLRTGALLTSGPTYGLVDQSSGGTLLRIVGGPGAGAWLPLRPGSFTVGRDQNCDLFVPDGAVSSTHLRVVVEPTGISLVDVSRNGTKVGAVLLPKETPTPVEPGQPIRIGDATLEIAPVPPLDGSVSPGPDGTLYFNRVTMQPAPVQPADIALPSPPPSMSSGGLLVQLLSSGGMVLAAVVAAVVFGRPQLLIISVLGPITFLIAGAVQRSGVRKTAAERQRQYEQRHAVVLEGARATAQRQEQQRRDAAPDLSALLLAAYGRRSSLWSRDTSAGLPLRLGLHDRTAEVRFSGGDPDAAVEPLPLTAVPYVLRLDECRVLGVAGDARAVALARGLVLQLAVLLPPTLQIVFLSSRPDSQAWSWLRWLPHVGKSGALAVGNTPESVRQRLDEVKKLVERRIDVAGTHGRQQAFSPVVVVLDGASDLRSASADVLTLLNDGPAVSVFSIALDDTPARLPAEATTRMWFAADDSVELVVQPSGGAPVTGVRADLLSTGFAERAARCLAPLTPLGVVGENALPDAVRFLDLVGYPTGTGDTGTWVGTHWAAGRTARAVVGVDQSGQLVAIDLPTEGPHALVAGTTGSGKSEFLRTLVGGLALSDAPHRLNLLLVDFKGGGAFGRLQDLPHVVGLATDLNIKGPLADRLLASLHREMDRRKELFARAKVSDISEYPDQPPGSPDTVARLVIVVDEFAQLKEAQPDFIDGLVQVATIGRSLGIHLVLATQRPQGVISPQIRDNAELRIALRVLDSATSQDLVGIPDAAAFPLSARGRALIGGGDGLPRTIQAGYLSGTAATVAEELPPPTVADVPWEKVSEQPVRTQRAEGGHARSDLDLLLDAVRGATAQYRIPLPRRPWLPPLPAQVLLSELPEPAPQPDGPAVPIALEDLPGRQLQPPLALRLGGGSVAILGGGQSGRTTALRAVAASLAQRLSPDEVHLHVADFGVGNGLLPVAALPHCGVSLRGRSDLPRLRRLLQRLTDEVDRRGRLLAQHGRGSLAEWRATDQTGSAPPFLVLLLDGWEAFSSAVEAEPGALRQGLLRLLDDGRAAGLQAVVTGGRALVSGSTGSHFETVLGLPFEQRDDYTLLGLRPTTLPAEIPVGRAHRSGTGTAVQFPLLSAEPTAAAQRAALQQIADAARLRWPSVRQEPLRLDELRTMPLKQALDLPVAAGQLVDPVLVGVGGDRLGGRRVDLGSGRPALLIAGSAGTGRSTALAVIAQQLADANRPYVIVGADQTPPVEDLRGAAVLVDDAGRSPVQEPWLEALLAGHDGPLVLAADYERLRNMWGWQQSAKQAAAILLLCPQRTYDGDAVGVSLDASQTFRGPAGRGILHVRGRSEQIQVPEPRP